MFLLNPPISLLNHNIYTQKQTNTTPKTQAPGFAKMVSTSVGEWVFPHGTSWADPALCGAKLHAKAKEAIVKEGNVSAGITEATLSVLDKSTVEALAAKCAAVLSKK